MQCSLRQDPRHTRPRPHQWSAGQQAGDHPAVLQIFLSSGQSKVQDTGRGQSQETFRGQDCTELSGKSEDQGAEAIPGQGGGGSQ